MDTISKEARSYTMSRIRSKHTKPEMIVRCFLHSSGLRFRLHKKNLPGSPDIVLSKYKTVINVMGCFWHGHDDCKLSRLPKSRPEYWVPKIQKNKLRDYANSEGLRSVGWNELIVWECELNKLERDATLKQLLFRIKRHGNR